MQVINERTCERELLVWVRTLAGNACIKHNSAVSLVRRLSSSQSINLKFKNWMKGQERSERCGLEENTTVDMEFTIRNFFDLDSKATDR